MARPDWQCWPDLRITLRPLPWTWHLRPRLYIDDGGVRSMASLEWLCITVEWWGQDPGHALFPMQDPADRSVAETPPC